MQQIRNYYTAMAIGSPSALQKAADDSIFILDDPDEFRLQEVLEKAVLLVRRARVDLWDRERLGREYVEFVKTYQAYGRRRSQRIPHERLLQKHRDAYWGRW